MFHSKIICFLCSVFINIRRTFNGIYKNNEHVLMAGAVLTILPILVVYLFSQRYVDQGISLGGLK